MPMEWIGHTCSSCKHADNPFCTEGGSTFCNRHKAEWGAQIIIFGREMRTHGCDAWEPRPKTIRERLQQYRQESSKHGFPPVDVRIKNNVIYGVYTPDDVHRLFKIWEKNKADAPDLIGICKLSAPLPRVDGPEVPVYTVFDNSDGNLWMEDFFNPNLAIVWLTGDYVDPGELNIADAIYVKEQLQKGVE